MSRKNKLTPPGLTFMTENIKNRQNVLGTAPSSRAAWAAGIEFNPTTETVFFAGCGYQYDNQLDSLMSLIRRLDKSFIGSELPMALAALPQAMGIDVAGIYARLFAPTHAIPGEPLRAAIRVLRHIGVNPGYLGEDEPCCGALMHFTGDEDDFAANARRAYDTLKSHGVKTIIGMVPSCTYALGKLIPRYVDDFDITVRHFAELVAESLDRHEFRLPQPLKVTWHDPCQLGRYLGIIEEPRRILRAIGGLELVEPEHTTGEWSTYCGGGGGFEAVFPEFSQILAVNRARELVETGVEVIVTHCPGCIMQIREGLKELKADNIKVLDLTQILALAIEE
jgi:heterodisulfide reductase subunit B